MTMNYIYCSITDEQLELVGDQDTDLKIMKTLMKCI